MKLPSSEQFRGVYVKNNIAPQGRIVIAGGTGFLGRNLASRLSEHKDCQVVLISRNPPPQVGPWAHCRWDGRTLGDWASQLDGASALVNLAGRSVDCIKTPENCDEILRSRVETTRLLGEAVRHVKVPPSVWVQMSTAHIYGDPLSAMCDENSATGYGFAPFVGREWESTFATSVLPQMRPVILRTSFVLGRKEGALPRLATLTRCGLGGTIGHGRQGISWIHERDMNQLLLRALTHDSMRGVYVATSPQPVSNAEFMRELRRVLRIPIGIPTPSLLLRMGATWVMRTDPELALHGRNCRSQRLQDEGFHFSFPDIRSALHDLLARKTQT